MEKTIYDMKLHEVLTIRTKVSETQEGIVNITRVPGGWVYAMDFVGYRQSPVVFIPFNNEFMPKAAAPAKSAKK